MLSCTCFSISDFGLTGGIKLSLITSCEFCPSSKAVLPQVAYMHHGMLAVNQPESHAGANT